jgi:hypothetical protein
MTRKSGSPEITADTALGQALANESGLARTAVRYKINMAQLAAAFRTELSQNKNGAEKRTTPARFATAEIKP